MSTTASTPDHVHKGTVSDSKQTLPRPVVELEIKKIIRDTHLQSRVKIAPDHVEELRELIADGETLEPVQIVREGTKYYLFDGWHRLEANEREGHKTILAYVQPGTRRDALLLSVSANAKHGLKWSPEDKRRAISTLLADSEWSQWSSREIGRRCGADHKTVERYRKELSGEIPQMRTVQRGESVYDMDVALASLPAEARVELKRKQEAAAEAKAAAEAANQAARPRKAKLDDTDVRWELRPTAEMAELVARLARKRGWNAEAVVIAILEEYFQRPAVSQRAVRKAA